MFRPISFLLTLSLAASPVSAAACIGPSDLAAGVTLLYGGGAQVDIQELDDGLVRIRERGDSAEAGDLQFVSRYGIYDLEASALFGEEVPADQRVTYDYGGAELTEPKAGAVGWTGAVTATFPGDVLDQSTAAYIFGEEGSLTLDGCTYRTVTVDATFLNYDGWEGQQFLYFADIGFAALVGRSGTGADREQYELEALQAAGR